MIKKFIIAIVGFVAVVLALGAVKVAQVKEMMATPHEMPSPSVTSTEAKAEAWSPVISSIGTLAPVEGVTIAADAEGTVVQIAVESGAVVKKGDLLVVIDTSVEDAQLAAAEARAALAKLQYDRAADLVAKNTVSQAELDVAAAQQTQAVAEVSALKATIERKKVRAPFDGRVGIRQVNVGQFVPRGRPLLPLQNLDPIYVNFNVPQRQLRSLAVGQKIALTVDAFDAPFEGAIIAINSEVDPATRNVAVQAKLANPEEKLRAGMFVQVEVELPSSQTQIVLPATAIAYAPYGNSVFIVEKMKDPSNPKGKEYLGVRQQFVKISATRGDLVSIEEGVKPGEQVVTSGVFKLRNYAPVQINNTVKPTANPAPKPSNA